jgi:hypothetical protein
MQMAQCGSSITIGRPNGYGDWVLIQIKDRRETALPIYADQIDWEVKMSVHFETKASPAEDKISHLVFAILICASYVALGVGFLAMFNLIQR